MKLHRIDEVIARRIGRRDLLRSLGIGAALVPLAKVLAACGDDAADEGASDATVADSADAEPDTAPDATATGWATGGTAAMTAKASYPDPFAVAGTTCELLCAATIGPCHTTSAERQDVSDGLDGIPLRLALKVVDPDCQPVSDAIVEIWHTNYKGSYSGDINTMCNKTAEDRAAAFMRGYQRTDANGRVDFDTCFPGWYSGRAIHIHFRVMTGDYAGSDSAPTVVTSQLFFAADLMHEIFASEPLYSDFGQPDTSVATDNVVGGEADPSPYICDTARMSDGAMLASKTLIVRASTDAANCAMKGAGGAGGPPP